MNGLLSVILPTYDEAGNIVPLIREILEVVEGEVEVVVVDDDSPDGTWRLVGELGRELGEVRLLHRTGQKGLTSALADGIAICRGDIVIWMDSDFSHPPRLIPAMLRALDDADCAVASRYVPGGADRRDEQLHRLLSWSINHIARLVLGGSFLDYTSGFIAVSRRALESVTLEGDYGEYFISLIHHLLVGGYVLREVPFVNLSREVGVSKTATSPLGFALRGRKYLGTILSLGARALGGWPPERSR